MCQGLFRTYKCGTVASSVFSMKGSIGGFCFSCLFHDFGFWVSSTAAVTFRRRVTSYPVHSLGLMRSLCYGMRSHPYSLCLWTLPRNSCGRSRRRVPAGGGIHAMVTRRAVRVLVPESSINTRRRERGVATPTGRWDRCPALRRRPTAARESRQRIRDKTEPTYQLCQTQL